MLSQTPTLAPRPARLWSWNRAQARPAHQGKHLRLERYLLSHATADPWLAFATSLPSAPSHVYWTRWHCPMFREAWLAPCAVGAIPVGNQSQPPSYPVRQVHRIVWARLGWRGREWV